MSHVDDLKSSGLKATLPRIKILDVFQHSPQRHMTAEDVFKTLLNEGAVFGFSISRNFSQIFCEISREFRQEEVQRTKRMELTLELSWESV